MKYRFTLLALVLLSIVSCQKFFDKDWWKDHDGGDKEDASSFTEIASIDIGEAGAAEITAYDPGTKRLFVVNNGGVNKIDVIGLDDLANLSVIASIDITPYQGTVNSVSVHDGLLAAAIQSNDKTAPGKVVVFKTKTYAQVKIIDAGAQPDMVTFSPDGKYILTANEGEPSTDYVNDPVGSVSVISIKNNFSVVNLDFGSFAGQVDALKAKGLRIFGPNASFAQDIEPEYVTVSDDSKTAWVTLQENNAIAKIDLLSKTVTDIFPLGFKNYNLGPNAIDPSDRDTAVGRLANFPVYGMYQPDAIAFYEKNGVPHLFTANEGDVREWNAFAENARAGSFTLDPTAFPNGSILKQTNFLGRLNLTKTLGDTDGDGDYDALYSFGARSFSIWNGNSGALMFDSKNDLDQRIIAAGRYDDGRSDDKSVEPEGLTLGKVGKRQVVFVGSERSDAILTYDISNPLNPVFLQILPCGDAPEGVLFIPAKDSPAKGHSLLVVSSEDDGVIKIYSPSK
jgi:hypothetical protein